MAGWLVMLLVWAALIAALVWGVTRLFPDHGDATAPAPSHDRHGEEAPPPVVDSRQR